MSMMMMHELPHAIGERPGDPSGLLVLAGLVRDDAPWLYELALEAYRTTKTGKRDDARFAMKRLRRAVEFTVRGPLSPEEYGLDGRALHMLVRELEHYLIEVEPSEIVESEETPASPKPPRNKRHDEG
jgi:hypothetical protein